MYTDSGETREYRGLSSDTKPTYPKNYIKNGSVFFEMDTEKVFMYDLQNNRWIELGAAE